MQGEPLLMHDIRFTTEFYYNIDIARPKLHLIKRLIAFPIPSSAFCTPLARPVSISSVLEFLLLFVDDRDLFSNSMAEDGVL